MQPKLAANENCTPRVQGGQFSLPLAAIVQLYQGHCLSARIDYTLIQLPKASERLI